MTVNYGQLLLNHCVCLLTSFSKSTLTEVAIGRTVRTSSLKNISLRHNRISASGGVPLALIIRDYPDVVPTPTSPTTRSVTGTPSSVTSSPTSSTSNLPVTSPPGTPLTPTPSTLGPLIPPPKHS